MVKVSTNNKRKIYEHFLSEGVFCCEKVLFRNNMFIGQCWEKQNPRNSKH